MLLLLFRKMLNLDGHKLAERTGYAGMHFKRAVYEKICDYRILLYIEYSVYRVNGGFFFNNSVIQNRSDLYLSVYFSKVLNLRT